MNLYIDIETVPTQRADIRQSIAENITAPAQYKKPESIQKWLEENREYEADAKWRKTALSGTFGEILCVCWAIDDAEPNGIIRTLEETESGLLFRVMSAIDADRTDIHGNPRRPTWVGHFLTNFDLRFLWQRCVVNGVRPNIAIPYNAKPWGDDVFDTGLEWVGLRGNGGSLDSICKAMRYEGKGDIDGSKVWDYVLAGRYEEILEYCKDDVVKTRLLHKRMTFQAD